MSNRVVLLRNDLCILLWQSPECILQRFGTPSKHAEISMNSKSYVALHKFSDHVDTGRSEFHNCKHSWSHSDSGSGEFSSNALVHNNIFQNIYRKLYPCLVTYYLVFLSVSLNVLSKVQFPWISVSSITFPAGSCFSSPLNEACDSE